jgi:hypothetical protein
MQNEYVPPSQRQSMGLDQDNSQMGEQIANNRDYIEDLRAKLNALVEEH